MSKPQLDIAQRHRTLIVLWFGLIMSVVMYFIFTLFVRPETNVTPNHVLTTALLLVAFVLVLISFSIKSRFLKIAEEKQEVDRVQPGYVIAWAICEVGALLGVIDFFVNNDPYYFFLLLIGAVGIAVQFPKRDHLLAATYKDLSRTSS